MAFEFKKLEIKQEGNLLQRLWRSPNMRRSVLFFFMGAAFSLLYYLVSIGFDFTEFSAGNALKSSIVGALFGTFIVNSPCARGKC